MSVGADPRVGSEVAGYRIEALLARGGMADVYRAVDARLGRNVALKLLAPDLAVDESFRERFLQESRVAASLDHPNVIPVYEAGEVKGLLYIAMRYVEGTDLKTIVEREGALEPERALEVLSRVAGALDAAHARGLVHRDVKPANVLIALDPSADPREHVYLSDFGLTKHAREAGLTQTGQFVGSADYAAPEQIAGGPLDGRADVYALGCVLFECLSGEPPFRRDSLMATLWSHVNDPPPEVSAHRPALGEEVDAVVARALAKRPADRYGSCRDLVADARRALGQPAGTRELPSGAVTFLFTDIEGSTRLLKRLRERYGDVLGEHQRLLREVFERHDGREIDTQGDSFFVAFSRARDAVLAAVAVQQAIQSHSWPDGADVRVRIGIHTGQAAVAGERYLGLGVHRAARICGAAHGGQVLLSQTTVNLLEDEEQELPGVTLRDLGEQRLKDLDRPVRLYQLETPPWREESHTRRRRRERRHPSAARSSTFGSSARSRCVGAVMPWTSEGRSRARS